MAEAVREYLELIQDREAVQQQKEWFLDQVKRGRRTLDVLSSKLYSYQQEGALHLAFGSRPMLADDMGLGKTVQAIAAAALLKEMRDIKKVVIICPASLKHQWAREIRRFTSLQVTVVEGVLLERRKLYREPRFFKIINYELVRHDQDELLKLRPDLLILDEAQRIKNWRSKTAQMVKALPSPYAFVLTGTPLENRIDELYSIFQFLDPRILGPLWQFNDRFYDLEKRPNGTYKVLGYKNLDQLRALIAPHVLRRTRDEVLKDLPSRTDNNYYIEMTDPQWKAYNEFKESLAKLIAKAQRTPLSPKEREILLMCLIKMRLICDALALHDKELPQKDHERTGPKLGELEEILTEDIASNGHKAVIFSQWATMLALTEPIIQRVGLGYVKLTGDVPSSKRGELIQQFFDDPNCRVFLSTDAGGVGLNLQAASLVINLDLPWNPAVLEQRIARAHRHSQLSSVQVINLIAKDTIDLRQLRLAEVRRQITVLFQEPMHYHATISDNISYGDWGAPDVTLDQIQLAAHQAGAETLIKQLPQGYNTLLGKWFHDGTDLSVGEWQRLALARAFLRAAPVLVLDEPTSAMDAWAEADWLSRVRQWSAQRTTLIITHRLTTARQADKIYVMEAGRIIEEGSHSELLYQGGRFAQAWQAQST